MLTMTYLNERCGVQPVGINIFGNDNPVFEVAKFLFVYCSLFRPSSTTLLVDSRKDLLRIKQHRGWESKTLAEGKVEDSKIIPLKILKNILGENYM